MSRREERERRDKISRVWLQARDDSHEILESRIATSQPDIAARFRFAGRFGLFRNAQFNWLVRRFEKQTGSDAEELMANGGFFDAFLEWFQNMEPEDWQALFDFILKIVNMIITLVSGIPATDEVAVQAFLLAA